jgi:DNA-binding MarR family transcriptional regulator
LGRLFSTAGIFVPILDSDCAVGYWLKQADNLLTEQINKVQAANRVSRFDWQVLNMLNELGSAGRKRLFETMRTFVDEPDFEEILSGLIERGWVEKVSHSGTEEFQLAEEGRRQHAVILATQKEVRARAMQGISEEEYATVIRVLQRIVSNLGGNSEGPA